MLWKILAGLKDLRPVYVDADSFDQALALARKIDSHYDTGFVYSEEMPACKGPRVLSVCDLEALEPGSVVWEEYWDTCNPYPFSELEPLMKTCKNQLVGDSGVTFIENIRIRKRNPNKSESYYRWWDKKPTEADRRAVPWYGVMMGKVGVK